MHGSNPSSYSQGVGGDSFVFHSTHVITQCLHFPSPSGTKWLKIKERKHYRYSRESSLPSAATGMLIPRSPQTPDGQLQTQNPSWPSLHPSPLPQWFLAFLSTLLRGCSTRWSCTPTPPSGDVMMFLVDLRAKGTPALGWGQPQCMQPALSTTLAPWPPPRQPPAPCGPAEASGLRGAGV